MRGLLAVTGLLLVGSGVVKLRAAGRAKMGLPLLVLIELVAGLGVFAAALFSPPSVDVGFRLVIGSIALVLGSSGTMAVRMARRSREREESEGARLHTYVKYLSAQDDTGE